MDFEVVQIFFSNNFTLLEIEEMQTSIAHEVAVFQQVVSTLIIFT